MAELLTQKPTLEIEGKTYTFRRLGILDVRKVAGIVSRRLPQLATVGDDTTGAGVAIVTIILEEIENLTPMICEIMGIPVEDFENPDIVPLADVPRIAQTLAEHPDIDAFVKNVQSLVASPAFQIGARRATPSPSN